MEHRKYKRVEIHSNITGRMVLTSQIRIVDLSMTGIRFSSMRRVNTNNCYRVRLAKDDVRVEVRGTVVRSTLKNAIVEGRQMPVYEVAMNFDALSREQAASLQDLIEKLEHE